MFLHWCDCWHIGKTVFSQELLWLLTHLRDSVVILPSMIVEKQYRYTSCRDCCQLSWLLTHMRDCHDCWHAWEMMCLAVTTVDILLGRQCPYTSCYDCWHTEEWVSLIYVSRLLTHGETVSLYQLSWQLTHGETVLLHSLSWLLTRGRDSTVTPATMVVDTR